MNAAYKHYTVIIIINTYQGNQAQDPAELSMYINTDKYIVFWTQTVFRPHRAENCSYLLLGVCLHVGIQSFGK